MKTGVEGGIGKMNGEGILQSIKYGIAVAGGLITGFLGGWDTSLKVLVAFVVLDYFTGLLAAYFEKKLDSTVGFKGITRKVLLFVPIGVGYYLDQLLGQQVLRSLAIWFYLANEGLSLVENLGRCGVPMPPGLVDALQQIKKRGEARSETNNN